MASPNAHSLLSPSSAHRWLVCTASPRFEEQFPATGDTIYSAEGTLAHSVCELFARHCFTRNHTKEEFDAELEGLQQTQFEGNNLFSQEMVKTARVYVNYLMEKANQYKVMPNVFFEQRVDLSDWIPEGFGSCDCIMIGDDTLHITDYKHGVGVPVDAKDNPQMRLYALGALKLFKAVYGDTIKKVSMGICQPRLFQDASEDSMTVEELREWGERVKPKAKAAYQGNGTFCPGEHCKFCRGKNRCPARSDANTALEDFMQFEIPKTKSSKKKKTADKIEDSQPKLRTLTNAEIGDLLQRGQTLTAWYNDLKDYALSIVLAGESVPGWKAVEGRSNRAIDDVDELIAEMMKSGYKREVLYKTEPLTLTAFEDLVGKTEFGEKFGKHIVKPKGKPTLAKEDDPKEAYNSAVADFKDVKING